MEIMVTHGVGRFCRYNKLKQMPLLEDPDVMENGMWL